MLEGKYQVILKTPMGEKTGELILKDENGVLTGSMTALGKTNVLMPGTTDGEAFQFSGEFQTIVGTLAYECSGKVEGDTITGVAKTQRGSMDITGKRVL